MSVQDSATTTTTQQSAHAPGEGGATESGGSASASTTRFVTSGSIPHVASDSAGGHQPTASDRAFGGGDAVPSDPKAHADFDYERCQHTRKDDWQNLLHHMQINRSPLYLAQMLARIDGAKQTRAFTAYAQAHDPRLLADARAAQGQVQAADKDYSSNAYIDDEQLQDHRGNTAYEDEILERLRKDGKLDDAAGRGFGSSGGMQAAMGQAMVQAERDGVIDARTIAADRHTGMQSVQGFGTGVAEYNEAFAAGDVSQKQRALHDARGHVAELDHRLAVELAQIGPTLSYEQQVQYAEKFHATAEYKQAVAAVERATADLEAALGRDGKIVDAFADASADPKLRGRAQADDLAAHRELAAGSREGANAALAWIDARLDDKAFGHVADLQAIRDIAQRTLHASLADEMRELLHPEKEKAAFGEEVKHAIETIKGQYVDPLLKLKHVVDVRKVPALLEKFDVFWRVKYGDGLLDGKVLSYLEKLSEEGNQLQPFAARLVGTVIDGVGAASSAAEPALGASAEKIASAGTELVDYARGVLEHLKGGSKTEAHETWEQMSRLLGEKGSSFSKLLPGVGLVAAAASTAYDWQALQSSADPQSISRFAGDAMITLGAAMELVPVLAPVGEALGIVGTAITVVSELLPHGPTTEQKDERKLLGKGEGTDKGIDAYGQPLIDAFTSDHGADNLAVAHEAGMRPDQVKELATRWPFLFTRELEMKGADNFRRWLSNPDNGGLKASVGGNLYTFLNVLAGHMGGAFEDRLSWAIEIGYFYAHDHGTAESRDALLAHFVGSFEHGHTHAYLPANDFSRAPKPTGG